MAKAYVTSAFLQAQNSQLYAVFGWSQRKPQIITSKAWLNILEIFVHEHSIDEAYHIYTKNKTLPLSEKVILEIDKHKKALDKYHEDFVVSLLDKKVTFLGNGFKSIVDQEMEIDLSQTSKDTYQLLSYLFYNQKLNDDWHTIDSIEAFSQLVEFMADIGLLSPAIGSLDWGDFKRKVPICHACGFTRGTPIDRYYLSKFVEEIQEEVVGTVLEVGAVPKDREFYDFSNRQKYVVLNLEAGSGVDIVGDVHESSLIEPESVDSVVIFNVLEHCHSPSQAVQNIHSWLKVGGKCFCLVPNAQRLHDRPADYWRPLPDGVAWLFQKFSKHKLYVYGNPMTVVAIFHGIAVEELSTADLDAFHPDYPVITCIVAEK